MRNALAPVTTVIALLVGALMSTTVITEKIFTRPGMGTLIVDAIFSRDMPLVQGAVLVVVVFLLVINLITVYPRPARPPHHFLRVSPTAFPPRTSRPGDGLPRAGQGRAGPRARATSCSPG